MSNSPRYRLDPKAVSSAIDTINTLDLQVASIEEILELLTPVFRGYIVDAPSFPPGVILFRARLCDKPANIGELSYPPAHLTRLGRVNRPNSPVLYCCTSRETPFFESRPDVGQTIAIVRWKTTAPLQVNHVGYTRTVFRKLRSNRKHAGWGGSPTRVPGNKVNRLVADFLAEAFTRPVPTGSQYFYKLPVAIAEKLYLDDMFDALLYPTVQMRANADNLAIKPSYADSHLKFLKAEFARITTIRDFGFDSEVLDTATELAEDGTIVWKGHGDQWELRAGEQVFFTVEDGHWVARDAAGRVVGPK